MNFMQKCKRNGGFTLVELIVVIAILAILAGVAVPAYTGYIKKAEEAADQQLLGAVNTAFAAACLEEGQDSQSIAGAVISMKVPEGGAEGKVIDAVTSVASKTNGVTLDAGKIDAAFQRYYAGNTGSVFKTIASLGFDPETGTFKNMEDLANEGKAISVVYKGNAINVSAQAVMNLQNSTFGQEIGAEALLKEVAGLTNLVGSGDINLESMLNDEPYLRSLASYMGVENADTISRDALDAAIDAKTEGRDAENIMLNGLVYYAAEKTTQMNASDITSFLTSGNVAANLGSDQATKLANASMAYGMYTAFVNSDQYTGPATSTTSDPMAALQTISGSGDYSEAFKTYMNSTEGQADLKAYMSAMSVINDSTGNDATLDVLGGGFDDSELVGLLTQALGK